MKILLLPVVGVTTFFIFLLLFTKLVGPIPFSVTSVTTQKSDTFNVSGEGKVTTVPDIALVTAGVQANGQTAKAAQDQINLAINRVSEAVKKLGVDSKDIKTVNYNISPTIDYNLGTQRITGYTASTNLQIKIREIDRSNDILDTATSNGANAVGGISFDIDDKTKFENQARELAVADAKRRAEDASRIAGFRLGRIVNYSENTSGIYPPMPFRATMAADVSENKATQVEPGSNEIVINVTLSYEVQ